MVSRLALRLRLLFAPDSQDPALISTTWDVHLETVDNTPWLVVTASLPCGCCAGTWAPSERSVLVRCVAEANTAEQSMRARMLWSRFAAYWQLTRLFREVRRERGSDPSLGEFYGFLQFPASFDWRRPSPQEQRQMGRWAAGLDDSRLGRSLYDRVHWLAEHRGG